MPSSVRLSRRPSTDGIMHSLLCFALNNPPIHVNSHRIGSALFSPAATLSLAAANLFSQAPRDADDALFAVNYTTGITTPLKPLIFHYQVADLFFSLSPTRLWVHLSEIGSRDPPHTPFTHFVRSNNLKPCLPAGFRDHINHCCTFISSTAYSTPN